MRNVFPKLQKNAPPQQITVLEALADEFYAEIIPVVVELRGKGLGRVQVRRVLLPAARKSD